MPDPQDAATPPTATTSGSTHGRAPIGSPRPAASFATPISGRHLGATWQIVAAMAVVVGLLTGVVTLLDRFSASPPVSEPVVTPAPTTPAIKVDVSSAVGAAELATFVEAQTGKLVDLDVSCFETVTSPACIFEGSGIEVPSGGDEWLFLWVFTGTPCFAPQQEQADGDPGHHGLPAASLFWIDPRVDGSPVVLASIQGAGTTVIKGPGTFVAGGWRLLPGQHPRLSADTARDRPGPGWPPRRAADPGGQATA